MQTRRYDSAFKKDILSYLSRMHLEGTMLNGISQSQKDKYCMIPLMCEVSEIVKLIEAESRMEGAKFWGSEKMGSGY